LTEKIAHDYKNNFERLVLKPSSGGVFEIRVNGQEIHSKKQTGQFPDQDHIIAEIGKLVPAQS
jgi:selenoprotein W-related protein